AQQQRLTQTREAGAVAGVDQQLGDAGEVPEKQQGPAQAGPVDAGTTAGGLQLAHHSPGHDAGKSPMTGQSAGAAVKTSSMDRSRHFLRTDQRRDRIARDQNPCAHSQISSLRKLLHRGVPLASASPHYDGGHGLARTEPLTMSGYVPNNRNAKTPPAPSPYNGDFDQQTPRSPAGSPRSSPECLVGIRFIWDNNEALPTSIPYLLTTDQGA